MDKSSSDSLGPCVSVEFTRDSPLFRQNIAAFEESFSNFSEFTQCIFESLVDMEASLQMLEDSEMKLLNALDKTSSVSRCLFTSCLPNLSDVSKSLHALSKTLRGIQNAHYMLRKDIGLSVIPIFSNLSGEDLVNERSMKWTMERNCSYYESLVESALQTRQPASDYATKTAVQARHDYEISRFDLVAQLNALDCKKKIMMNKGCSNLHQSYANFSERLKRVFDADSKNSHFEQLRGEIEGSVTLYKKSNSLWRDMRWRLSSEINGELPPPGMPIGAMIPGGGQKQRIASIGIPQYTITLTTEILKTDTREARFEDTRHARDDGVFKQGFLFVPGGMFSRRKRLWHRLFSTKLYSVELMSGLPACSSDLICDMVGAVVKVDKVGRLPHHFEIITANNKHIDLQAENDDEMMKWINALVRCTKNHVPGRPLSLSKPDTASSSLQPAASPSLTSSESPAPSSSSSATSSVVSTVAGAAGAAAAAFSAVAFGLQQRALGSTKIATEIPDPRLSSSALREKDTQEGGQEEIAVVGTGEGENIADGYSDTVEFNDEQDGGDVVRTDTTESCDNSSSAAGAVALAMPPPQPPDLKDGWKCFTDNQVIEFTAAPTMMRSEVSFDKVDEKDSDSKRGRSGRGLRDFVSRNSCCAECSATPVSWVSINLGVTVCEDCAVVHGQLTWSLSKLKNIEYDEFSEVQIQLLLSRLGNTAVNAVWEHTLPEGWAKPEPKAPQEDKTRWIMSKYRWYGFAERVDIEDSADLLAGLMGASIAGDVRKAMWWLAHRADINGASSARSHRTPLHEAVEAGHVELVLFLLLNGADLNAADAAGVSCLDLAQHAGPLIESVVSSMQGGVV